MSSVQVKLELGHRATLRDRISEDGFTHDWTVFVRGPDSCNIQHFVEKVIFNLHKDFAKPKRVIKEPPYEVSESGYGSFIIPIEVYFKQKEDPKKVQFEYDLFLNIQNPTNHIRCEKLTFQNPTDEFRRKLFRAGAVGINNTENSGISLTPHYQRPSTPNLITGTLSSQSKDRKSASVAIKAPKSSTSSGSSTQAKETSSVSKPSEGGKSVPPAPPPASKSFVDLFGQPISKTNKPSPDPQKIKNGQPKKSNSSSNQSKSSSSNSVKDSKASGVKDTKSQVKEKIFSKRSLSPLPDSSQSKKRKRSTTSSPSSHGSVKSGKDIDNKLSEKKSTGSGFKSKSDKKEKCSKEKSSVTNSVEEVKSGKEVISKPVKKLKQERALASSTSPSLSTNSSVGSNSEINRSRETPQSESRTQDEGDVYGGGEESRSSTSSFSSVHQYKGSGPLGALMAELDDEQDGFLSPLSSDGSPSHKPEPPPPIIVTPENPVVFKHGHEKVSKSKTKEEKIKEPKSKKSNSNHHDSTNELNGSENKKTNKKSNSGKLDPPGFRPLNKPPRPLQFEFGEEYITELQDLQRRIMLLKDRQHLQQIVNVIEETGQYQVTNTTFDFDLCRLDKVTVKKLQSCFMNI